MRLTHPVVSAVVGLAVIGGLVALNGLVFSAWLDTEYVRWYLDNGAAITLVFGLVTLAWGDLNSQTGLISAHPAEYVGASLGVVGVPWFALSAMGRPARKERAGLWPMEATLLEKKDELRQTAGDPTLPAERRQAALHLLGRIETIESAHPEGEEESRKQEAEPPTGLPVLDFLLSALFSLAFLLACVAWLFVIAPLQYFVYLVTGAPARAACASPTRAWFRQVKGGGEVAQASKQSDLPEGAVESGFSARPVSLTAAITAGVLFAVSQLTGL